MKRLTLILLAFLPLLACMKQTPPAGSVDVTFNLGGVRTGSIATKGSVDAILTATAPPGALQLTITSTTNASRIYHANIGQAVNLPIDTYHVTGEYIPQVAVAVWHGNAYQEPRYLVDAQLTIQEGQDSYTLEAQYNCFALVIDFAECAKYGHTNSKSSPEDITAWAMQDGMGVLYVNCIAAWTATSGYTIYAYPVDTAEKEMQAYTLVMAGAGGYPVEYGKWYCFTPAEVDKQSGSLSTSFPAWVPGQE